MERKVVVCGAGGFIGGHLVKRLLSEGHSVRAVDVKLFEVWEQRHEAAENRRLDLKQRADCQKAVAGATIVYNLAADMGGIGFIGNNRAFCMLNVLINTHLLLAAREAEVEQFFFASSACIYPLYRQGSPHLVPLQESDAYPADCEDGYGWEKLFSERMCRAFTNDFHLPTTVARLHNVYGPHGAYDGGREKAPAALCRKVAQAKLSGQHEIEIWGDGEQTRSFMYIDDCIEGICRMMSAQVSEPLNLGSSQLVTINQLVALIEEIAGLKVRRVYNHSAPMGVRGRNSDNARIRTLLDWEPSTPLRDGLEPTYRWIFDRLSK